MPQATDGYKSSRVPLKIPRIVNDKKFPNMYRITFEAGGPVHKSISGLYGRKAAAQKAIDDWVIGYNRPKITPHAPYKDIPQKLNQRPKVEKNGEEKSIS